MYRQTIIGASPSLTYVYSGKSGGPHAVTAVNGATYWYDPAGREFSAPGRIWTDYRSWGLPAGIIGAVATDHFKYDFQHQRVLKTSSDGTHSITIGGLFERRAQINGTRDIYYVPGSGQIVAARQDQGGSSSRLYLHEDRLGSVDAVTDAAGHSVDSRGYEPFGVRRKPSDLAIPDPGSASELPPGFTERDRDSEVGLLNLLGRLYDARIGAFTTPDPLVSDTIGSQGYNRYRYVRNNPLRGTDPTGFQGEPYQQQVDAQYGFRSTGDYDQLPNNAYNVWNDPDIYYDTQSQLWGLDVSGWVLATSDDAGTRVPLIPGPSTGSPSIGSPEEDKPEEPGTVSEQTGALAQAFVTGSNARPSAPVSVAPAQPAVASAAVPPVAAAAIPPWLLVGRGFQDLFGAVYQIKENFALFNTPFGTIRPDIVGRSAFGELKFVQELEMTSQFQGYFSLGRPVHIIVGPHTKIASEVIEAVKNRVGSSIRVFNPETGTLAEYGTGVELSAGAAVALITALGSTLYDFFTGPILPQSLFQSWDQSCHVAQSGCRD